jgi:hypothetical protein
MAVKRKASAPKRLDTEQYAADVEQFLALEAQMAEFDKRKKEIRLRLVDAIEQFGEADDKGHIFLDLPDEVRGVAGLKWERRVSRNLDADKAEKVLDKQGLLADAQTTITVLDESKIEALFYEDKITKRQYDSMFPETETRALQKVKA